MLRRISLLSYLLFALMSMSARAAIWPDLLIGHTKQSSKALEVEDVALMTEYGLQEVEQAEYVSGDKRFVATAYQMVDSTGALALFQLERPREAVLSEVGKLAVETPDTLLLAFGNYVLRFEGAKPESADLEPLLNYLPRLEQSPLPAVTGYFPTQNLVPNSGRYVLGPVSLERFEPRIPPSVASFHMGAEAQLGRFQIPSGEMGLAVFYYPTPHIARDRLVEFQKLPGIMVKRSGPLLGVITSPSDPDAAERILSQVRYQASITWSEYVPNRRDNIGNLIINIFILIGILFAFSAVVGVTMGSVRAVAKAYLGRSDSDDSMTRLNISGR